MTDDLMHLLGRLAERLDRPPRPVDPTTGLRIYNPEGARVVSPDDLPIQKEQQSHDSHPTTITPHD